MSQGHRDKSVVRIIRVEVERGIRDTHVNMPGEILSYDPTTKLATIQPHFNVTLSSGETEALAKLCNVPIKFPQTHGFIIEWPISAGDLVDLVFSDQSLDTWILEGKAHDSLDCKIHDLSDATATPTFNIGTQLAVPDPLDPQSLDIRIAKLVKGVQIAAVKIKPDGTIILESPMIKLGSEASARSPLPQESFVLWLTAFMGAFSGFMEAMQLFKVEGPIPFDTASITIMGDFKTLLDDLLNQFVQDAAPPGGTGIGFGNISAGIKIT